MGFCLCSCSAFPQAFLAWPFGLLKFAVEGQPGVPKDLSRILGWYWQRLRHRAPKNKHILQWTEVGGRGARQRGDA